MTPTLCNSPEAHRHAARLVWQQPDKWTADTVSNALVVALAESRETTDAACQLAERQRVQVRELADSVARAERDEAALRRHFRKHLERLGQLHEALVVSNRGEDGGQSLSELIAQLGQELSEERKGLSE